MTSQHEPPPPAGDPDSIYRAPESKTGFVPQGDALTAYVGPKNAEYYARRFDRFKTENSAVSWNWPAFFVTSALVAVPGLALLLYLRHWIRDTALPSGEPASPG